MAAVEVGERNGGNGNDTNRPSHSRNMALELFGVQASKHRKLLAVRAGAALLLPEFIAVRQKGIHWGQQHPE